MPDELKPCPNHECPNPMDLNCGHAGGCWWVSCACGCRSPAITKERRVIDNREAAVAAWNALPRAPRWTEFDGAEATRPKYGDVCLVETHYGAKFTVSSWDFEIGDRWMHWPEGGA